MTKDLYINIKGYKKFTEDVLDSMQGDPTSIWGAIRGTIMSGINMLMLDKNSPEYSQALANFSGNNTVIMTQLSSAKNFITKEVGVAGEDASKAGSQLLNWFTGKLGGLKETLGIIFNTIVNTIAKAARASFSFLKGIFDAFKDPNSGGVWQFLKTNNFLGFPASTWLIWGTIAAFCIIVFTKFVKWLKRKKTDNPQQQTQESLEQYLSSDCLLFEQMRFTEGVSETIYKKAGQSAMDLNKETEGAESGSFFWKTIKTISIILLSALGIYACLMATANGYLPEYGTGPGGSGVKAAANSLVKSTVVNTADAGKMFSKMGR